MQTFDLADIVIDEQIGQLAIIVAKYKYKDYITNYEYDEYLIAYLDKLKNYDSYQALSAENLKYVRKPNIDEIKAYKKHRNALIERELLKYENEYKDMSDSLDTLISNLKFYGLM